MGNISCTTYLSSGVLAFQATATQSGNALEVDIEILDQVLVNDIQVCFTAPSSFPEATLNGVKIIPPSGNAPNLASDFQVHMTITGVPSKLAQDQIAAIAGGIVVIEHGQL